MGDIVPVEQKSIEFYGEMLIALRDTQGTIWLPVRRLCEAIGVSVQGQLSKINDDPVMREHLSPFPVTLPDGRTYEMECLSLRFVRAWLFSVNANRVRPQVKNKLIQYQREVIEIIDRHFTRPVPTGGMDERIMEAMRDNALQQAKLWEVMIEEQRRLRAAEELLQEVDDRLGDHDRMLDDHAHALNELRGLQSQQSLLLSKFNDVIRLLPAPADAISPAQKSVIKELVDDVVAAAQEKWIRLGQGRNDYPAVWAALKHRFEVAKYDELTVAQFDACVTWLKQWKARLNTQAGRRTQKQLFNHRGHKEQRTAKNEVKLLLWNPCNSIPLCLSSTPLLLPFMHHATRTIRLYL